MRVSEALKLITQRFREEKIPVVLIGGMALYFYGSTRLTTDVDFLISECHSDLVGMILEKEGYEAFQRGEAFSRFRRDDLLLKAIDFILVDSLTFDRIQKEGKQVEMGGIPFTVPSLFHLIAMKLHAVRNNADRKGKDAADIAVLIKENQLDVNSREMKNIFKNMGRLKLNDLSGVPSEVFMDDQLNLPQGKVPDPLPPFIKLEEVFDLLDEYLEMLPPKPSPPPVSVPFRLID